MIFSRFQIRPLCSSDYLPIVNVIDDWWSRRSVSSLLPRLFFEHFQSTSFVMEEGGDLRAFLIGFQSQTIPALAYVHFVGVNPKSRREGLGRILYTHFMDTMRGKGCQSVEAITSPVNAGSVAFHRALGFELLPGADTINGFPVTLDYAGLGQLRVRFHKALKPIADLI